MASDRALLSLLLGELQTPRTASRSCDGGSSAIATGAATRPRRLKPCTSFRASLRISMFSNQ